MNIARLIDAVMAQTMKLVAQFATTAGMRAPLAHMQNQIFLALVTELKSQGVSQKVIADMFGMALRSYHAKVRRLTDSDSERGFTLWEMLYEHVVEHGPVTRAGLLEHFRHDDVMTVRGVLNELVTTGLVFRSGRGPQTLYQAVGAPESGGTQQARSAARDANLAWISVYRLHGATRTEIQDLCAMSGERLDAALASLLADGRVAAEEVPGGDTVYTSELCVFSYGDSVGWEGAVLDHYEAMVSALTMKLGGEIPRAELHDAVGGSTYRYEVWEGHPERDEVVGFLAETRARASDLRQRVQSYNDAHAPEGEVYRVAFYAGQSATLGQRDD